MSRAAPYVEAAGPTEVQSRTGDFVVSPIPAGELAAERRRASRRFGAERVLILRLHEGRRKSVAYANIVCVGTKLGTISDEQGIAWLYGMATDSMEIKILALTGTSGTIPLCIRAGELVGLDVRVPPVVPKHMD